MPLVLLAPYQKKILAQLLASGSDPYFRNVLVLARMNGANGSGSFTNETGRAMVGYGGASLSTTQKKFGTASYLANSSTAINVRGTNSSAVIDSFDMQGLDFTMEAWIYRTSASNSAIMGNYRHRIGYRGGAMLYAKSDGSLNFVHTALATAPIVASPTGQLALNTWQHVAVSRNGDVWRLFIDGQIVATVTQAFTISNVEGNNAGGAGTVDESPYDFHIGFFPADVTVSGGFVGHIDEVRYTKGVGRYTTNFIPQASEYSNGGLDLYSANVSVLMHGTTTLTDVLGHTFTSNNVSVTTSTPRYEGSALFNGTDSWMRTTGDASLTMGSGDFTHEVWIYVKARPATQCTIFTNAPSLGTQFANTTIGINLMAAGNIRVQSSYSVFVTGTTNIPLNTWTHVAYCRIGNVMRLFINGVQEGGDVAFSHNLSDVTDWMIGNNVQAASAQSFNGQLCDLRVTKAGRYAKNFYPGLLTYFNPTDTALIEYVTLLMHMNGADNSTVFNDVKGHAFGATGGAVISTAQSKFGGSSAYFDGDALIATPFVPEFAFGTGDLTVEAWVRPTARNVSSQIIGQHDYGIGNNWLMSIQASGTLTFYTQSGASVTSTGVVPLNAWTHVAAVRQNGVVTLYINGVKDGSATVTTDMGSSRNLTIGGSANQNANAWFIGYIDEVRITKGIARYLAPFPVPTAAFSDS